MKLDGILYDFGMAPNPRRVRIYLAEKGIEVERREINIMKREQKDADFRAKNSNGQIPVLELLDGTCISESISICRYVEARHPTPPLFGTDAKSIALIDMWLRRVDLNLMFTIGQVWVHGSELTKALGTQIPEAAERGRQMAASGFRLFDASLANHEFIAGDAYSVADASALATIDFGINLVGVEYDESLTNLKRWHDAMKARPSAAA